MTDPFRFVPRKWSPGAYFNDGKGSRYSVQQDKDAEPDPLLIAAILAARQVFWEIYHGERPDTTPSKTSSRVAKQEQE